MHSIQNTNSDRIKILNTNTFQNKNSNTIQNTNTIQYKPDTNTIQKDNTIYFGDTAKLSDFKVMNKIQSQTFKQMRMFSF